MREFLRRACIFTVGFTALIGAAAWFLPNPRISDSMYAAVLDKHALLERTSAPRLLVLGGSNTSFGIDSAWLEERLGIPVVNLGIHAGFGLRYMLADLRRFLRSGDVVLIVPEYEQFLGRAAEGEVDLLYVLVDVDPGGWGRLTLRQGFRMLGFVPQYAAEKIVRIPREIRDALRTPAPSGPPGIYDRGAFNEHGDVTVHWTLPDRTYVPAAPPRGPIRAPVIDLLAETRQEWSALGVTTLVAYPSFQASQFDLGKEWIDELNETLEQRRVTVLSQPIRYRMNDELFFNSSYHLNSRGVRIRTERLAEDLLPILAARQTRRKAD